MVVVVIVVIDMVAAVSRICCCSCYIGIGVVWIITMAITTTAIKTFVGRCCWHLIEDSHIGHSFRFRFRF